MCEKLFKCKVKVVREGYTFELLTVEIYIDISLF